MWSLFLADRRLMGVKLGLCAHVMISPITGGLWNHTVGWSCSLPHPKCSHPRALSPGLPPDFSLTPAFN